MERGSKSAVDHAEHWSCNISAASFIVCWQYMQTYIVDSYARFAVNDLASCAFLAGTGFPPFALYMYDIVDYGWGQCLGICWHRH